MKTLGREGTMHERLIKAALKKYGSVRAIATAMESDQSNLNKAVRAKKLPPLIAHALARDLEFNPCIAILESLRNGAISEKDKSY